VHITGLVPHTPEVDKVVVVQDLGHIQELTLQKVMLVHHKQQQVGQVETTLAAAEAAAKEMELAAVTVVTVAL
tara:strand:+ start:259 stop:477 length:219 start_codon:yes stop_codon:yes gene_type:complete